MSALGDSTKRLWGIDKASTFGDLLSRWWPSQPHRQVEDMLSTSGVHDMGTRL